MVRVFRPHELPCAIGQSPFRIKGMAYRQTWASCADVSGGAKAVAARLPPGEARAFLTQTFLAAGWYDVLPMVWLDAAKAESSGRSYEESFALDSVAHARASLGGVYRALLRLVSAGLIASVLPRIVHTFYDFGEVSTSRSGPEGVSVDLRGVPLLLADWYMLCSGAFIVEALTMGGTRASSAEWARPKPAGMRDRFALTDLSCRLRWGAAPSG